MARRAPRFTKNAVPAWMLSFSDMMTNLLCFFILMVALSTSQDAGFVDAGIGSHFEHIEALGLPGIKPSTRTLIPKDSPLARYRPPRIDPLQKENWTEHTESMLHEVFDRLRSGTSTTEPPGKRFPIPLGIVFSPGSARLTLKDRRDLDTLAPTLAVHPGVIEVTGFTDAGEATSDRAHWDLSLQRASAVVRYLSSAGVPQERMRAVGSGVNPGQAESTAGRKVILQWQIDSEGE